MHHNIHLNELPPEGKLFEGEFRVDLFGLSHPEDPKFRPPMTYSMNVRLDGADVIVEGTADAVFEVQCARCTERFPWRVMLDPYYSQEPREGASSLDLTAQLREDILLALPGYPHCEESNVESRVCPAADLFAPESDFIPISGEEDEGPPADDRNVWDALKNFRPASDADTDKN